MQDHPGIPDSASRHAALDAAIAGYIANGYQLLSRTANAARLQRLTRTSRYAVAPAIGVILVIAAVRLSSSIWPSRTIDDTSNAAKMVILLVSCAAYALWLALRRVADRVDLQLDMMGRVLVSHSRVHALHPRRYALAAALSGLGTVLAALGLAAVLITPARAHGIHACIGIHYVGNASICLVDDSSIALGALAGAQMTIGAPAGGAFSDQPIMLTVEPPDGASRTVHIRAPGRVQWVHIHLARVLTVAGITANPGTYRIAAHVTTGSGDVAIGTLLLTLTQ